MMETDSRKLAEQCVEICRGRKAEGLRVYDVQSSSMLADYYIICSGSSSPHIRAISERLSKDLSDEGLRPRAVEGTPASQWMILDYGVVVVHIFQPECRAHYDIESLWDSGTLVYQDEPDAAFTGFA